MIDSACRLTVGSSKVLKMQKQGTPPTNSLPHPGICFLLQDGLQQNKLFSTLQAVIVPGAG